MVYPAPGMLTSPTMLLSKPVGPIKKERGAKVRAALGHSTSRFQGLVAALVAMTFFEVGSNHFTYALHLEHTFSVLNHTMRNRPLA